MPAARDAGEAKARLRREAAGHFSRLRGYAIDEAGERESARQELIGNSLLEAILEVAEGAYFSPFGWLSTSPWAGDRLSMWRVLPYLCGSLGLLQIEFHHEVLGALPLSVVREVNERVDNVVLYNGESLCADNVVMKFRRTAVT